MAKNFDSHAVGEGASLPAAPGSKRVPQHWILDKVFYSRLVRIVALCCIGVGVFMRVFQFGGIPPGLNQDEASVGYDAWCLFHYGTEGNGVSWPVHLISWGDGGNASYAYMAAPFVAFGLSPFTLRLPMLMTSLLSLFLVWVVALRLFDDRAAWASTAAIALSPWHIMLSRWALDCNALPFLFLCGLVPMAVSLESKHKFLWLVLASVMFGVSVYSYGAAYLAVPLFVLGALTLLATSGLVTRRQALISALVFTLTALPMALYIVVSVFHLSSIHLAGVTVPRLPRTPRFEKQLADELLPHIGQLIKLLVTQRDGGLYNVTDPYGFVYSGVFLALAFVVLAIIPTFVVRRRWSFACLLLPLWIIVCVPTGVVQEPNINRVNLLIMGLVLSVGVALATLDRWIRGTLVAGLLSLLIFSGFFARDYFTTQRDRIAVAFFDGFLPALSDARINTPDDGKICVTGRVNMPQIYALFESPSDEKEYVRTVQYTWTAAERTGDVISYGRYTFGLQRCDFSQTSTVVARRDEPVPTNFVKRRSYEFFDVYAAR